MLFRSMGLYLLGGFLALKAHVTVPVLLAFMEYYAEFVNHPLSAVDILLKKGEQKESVKRIQELLKLQQPERPYEIQTFEKLELCNIDFKYTGEQELVLRDFSLDIHKGESIALKGESGCGKSTLLKLIAGYLVPARGEIRWNGYPMNLVNRPSIYAKTGFLMQEGGVEAYM